MKSGIYTITNTKNGKLYVGRSKDAIDRLRQHKRNLKKKIHCNHYLQAAYNLEPDNFKFEVLEFYPLEILPDMEQYWMNLTQASNRLYGYNLEHSAYAGTIGRLAEETKEKIRQKHLGKKVPRDIVEKVRLANTGQKRPTHSETMKKNWEKVKQQMGFNNFTPEKRAIVCEKLCIATKARYSKIENLPLTRQEVIVKDKTGKITVYPSIHKAAAGLEVDRGAIKYAVQNAKGLIKKLQCTVSIKSQK